MITELKRNKAFTLIELIVVIAVIGILVLLAAPKFLGYTKDAKLTQIKNDVRAYEIAIEAELIQAEVSGVDQLAEWDWTELAESTLQDYASEGSLFDKKGAVSELKGGGFYELARADLPAKSKLKGDFIYSKSGNVFYHESGFGKGEIEVPEGEMPEGFTLLTDDDFEFIKHSSAPNEYIVEGETAKGYFHYEGEADKVVIPHEIMGNDVKDYYRMFYKNGTDGNGAPVVAVVSDNGNVTDMSRMFWDSQAKTLDLSKFDTSSVTNMSSMFWGSQAKTLDLSSFDTEDVTDMNNMFYNSQATSLDLSGFDTSNVTDMSSMFWNSQATSLNLSGFNTGNVTDMGFMFNSSKATSLDLSGFDTAKVTDMSSMFSNSRATSLDLSGFDTENVTEMNYIFWNSQATTGYARTQVEADRFNNTEEKPSGLKFAVK